ncbi:MAG: pantoate--beta-alanine ligase [Chitinophagales bacterium]
MNIFYNIQQLQNQILVEKKSGGTIGFVPTMGALHAGHLSLIMKARQENDIVVCSIFVNPTQFNDKRDFDKYPVDHERDIKLLKKAGCHIVFLPNVKEMYPKGFKQTNPLDFGFLAQTLEGEFRPGHFAGMAWVVELLLRAVQPHRLYMGSKDYQQAMICGELIRKRRMPIQLVVCDTRRERDGLAMSSRNVRLSAKARMRAPEISKTLKWVKREFHKLSSTSFRDAVTALEIAAIDRLQTRQDAKAAPFNTEYIAIRNAKTLKPLRNHNEPAVVLAAAWLDGVRLIDNMLL